MKPLSIIKYYINNKKKFFSVFIAIALSVLLDYCVQSNMSVINITADAAFIEPPRIVSVLYSAGKPLDPELANKVKSLDEADRVMPFALQSTMLNGFGGTLVFSVKHEDMSYLISKFNLKLDEGRLPEPGTHEIVMQWQVAASKGLKVGDTLGTKVDKNDTLAGKYKLVGLLKGKPITSFTSLETTMKDNKVNDEYSYGILATAGKDSIEALKRKMEDMKASQDSLLTLSAYKDFGEKSISRTDTILNIANVMLIMIVSICVGFLSYIYFFQRRSEFGLLNALGYSRQKIIRRAFAEIGVMNLTGFVVGLLLAILTGYVLNGMILNPAGLPMQLWNPDYVIRTFCIPLFVTLFSILPVWRMLIKIDPISIIEGTV